MQAVQLRPLVSAGAQPGRLASQAARRPRPQSEIVARRSALATSSVSARGTVVVRRAAQQDEYQSGDAQGRDESYANGEIFEAGEGLGMAAGADEAGSATIDLIDVAVAAASAGTVSALKARLLRAVAGVDRGVAATSSDIQTIEEAAQALESTSRDEPEPLERIDERISGKWRLVYSSTFAGKPGGSQGFTGAPTSGTPLRLGAVYQRIQPRKQVVDNIVEVVAPAPVPFAPPLKGSATLSHSLEVTGPRSIRITFDSITFRPQGFPLRNIPLRPLTIPSPFKALQLPPEFRGGAFETTFADDDVRVSRGDRGELRIFVRA